MAVRNKDDEWEKTRKVSGHDRDEQAAMRSLFRSGRIGMHHGHLARTCHIRVGAIKADSKARKARNGKQKKTSGKRNVLSAIDYAVREGEYTPPKNVESDLVWVAGDPSKMRDIVKDVAKNVRRKTGPQAESIVKTLVTELPETPPNATDAEKVAHLEKVKNFCESLQKQLADQGYPGIVAAHNHAGNIHIHAIFSARPYRDGKIDRTGAKTELNANGKVISRTYGSTLWQYNTQIVAVREAVATLINETFDSPVKFFAGKDRKMDVPGLALLDEQGNMLFDAEGRVIMSRPPRHRIPEAEYIVHGVRDNAEEERAEIHRAWEKRREEGRENAAQRRAEKAERDRLRLERLAEKALAAEQREKRKPGRKPGSTVTPSPSPDEKPWKPATLGQNTMVKMAVTNNFFSLRDDWASIVDGDVMSGGIRVAEKLRKAEGQDVAQEYLDGIVAQSLKDQETRRLKTELAAKNRALSENETFIKKMGAADLDPITPAEIKDLDAPRKWQAANPRQIAYVNRQAEKANVHVEPEWYKTFDIEDAKSAIATATNLVDKDDMEAQLPPQITRWKKAWSKRGIVVTFH